MAFQPVPDCSLIELIFNYNAQSVENTFGVRTTGGITAIGLSVITNTVKNWWLDEMREQLSSDIQLVQVVGTYKGDPEGPQFIDATDLPSPGAVPTEGLPNGTALVIKLATENIGRSFRGRNYIPGLPQSAVVNSFYQPGQVVPVVNAYNTLIGQLEVLGFPMVVISRKSNNVLRPFGIITNVTSATNVSMGTRSQRRRNPGIGA